VSRLLRRAMVDPSRGPAGRLAEYEANFSRTEAARAALDYYRQGFRRTLSRRGRQETRDYPRIRAPFLLIWGEQDAALRKQLTQGLEPYFERKPVVHSLPEEGHFVPLEAPEKVAALLLEHFSAGRARMGEAARWLRGVESHEGQQPPA
jgi:pimeloyl-ACP methyl ester carboxylesterase